MEYRPNWMAQSLVKGRANLVAFVVPGRDIYTRELSVVARGVLHEHGLVPVFYPTDNHEEWESELFEVVLMQRAAGVLWLPCTFSDMQGTAGDFAKAGTPLVILDRYLPGCPAAFVYTNDEVGISTAVDYLLDQGHRRFGCITGPQSILTMRWRKSAFEKALERANIPSGDVAIAELSIDPRYISEMYHPAHDAALDMLSRKNRPTAILTGTDEQAWGVLDAARDQGISVPDELRIIGYGDYIPAHFTRCRLSVVVQDREQIVARAVAALVEKMRGKYEARHESIVIPTELAIRDT